ncbi:hypothetical protein [Streptomyces argyrophylli]|uniref:hypothetical protein n=1 Tax=Streptomyces argyrophylli TaxID=2726118 RepID=UPI0020177C64|nr:hypothetical protein [Streptomyces argyrophyllae]
MTDASASLGPLELFHGRWVVGDTGKGHWVEFRRDGLYQHEPDSAGHLVPWSRIMLGMNLTMGSKYPARGSNGFGGLLGGLPGPWRGRGSGYLHMTLRHPYENWIARFDRHPRSYPGAHLVFLQLLTTQVIDAGQAQLLGDPDWLGRVVARLAPQRPRGWRGMREAVTRAVEAEA